MSASVSWDASGFNAHLRAMAERADAATRQAVVDSAALVERKAKENSSGRPGPNVQSGAHRRSIVTDGPSRVGNTWEARVGPTMVYSRRLELGGGNWPAGLKFPYLGPAMEWTRNGPIGEVFRRHWQKVHQ